MWGLLAIPSAQKAIFGDEVEVFLNEVTFRGNPAVYNEVTNSDTGETRRTLRGDITADLSQFEIQLDNTSFRTSPMTAVPPPVGGLGPTPTIFSTQVASFGGVDSSIPLPPLTFSIGTFFKSQLV